MEIDGIFVYQKRTGREPATEVQTFDIFDTLLARRCVTPQEIFDSVEIRSGHANFKVLRVRAEAALYQLGEYTFEDIYRRMVAGGQLDEGTAAMLKALELDEEFTTLIPVAEHVAQVRPGDILVSDMYLPRPFLTRVVREICGLHVNPIYLSAHGKTSGRAWDTLTRDFKIRRHTGDSLFGDVEMCRRRGIPAVHTTVTQLTEHERMIETLGYRGLARAVREARLGYWREESDLRALGLAQIEKNFPLLALVALYLRGFAAERGYRKILFSSRDCFLLLTVFRDLAARLGGGPEAHYFMTSRIARATPSPSYLVYLAHLSRGEPTLIVDLCGSGWSLTRLLEVSRTKDIDVFVMHQIMDKPMLRHHRTLADISRDPTPLSITKKGNNVLLESFNTAAHDMVVDVIQVQDDFAPVFLGQQPDALLSNFVTCGEHAMASAMRCLEGIDPDELRGYVGRVKDSDVEACYLALRPVPGVTETISRRQLSENAYLAPLIRKRTAMISSLQ